MPTIRVTVSKNAWTEEEKGKMARSLTGALAQVAQDSGKDRIEPHITVQVQETAAGGYAVGDKVVD